MIELVGLQEFDGIFGFSQGAAVVGMLAALRDAESAPISFDMAIMVGGFASPVPQHANLFRHKLTVPSLHVMGRGDGTVSIHASQLLAARFASPVIIEHGGGHVIPGDPAITTRIADFVANSTRIASSG